MQIICDCVNKTVLYMFFPIPKLYLVYSYIFTDRHIAKCTLQLSARLRKDGPCRGHKVRSY